MRFHCHSVSNNASRYRPYGTLHAARLKNLPTSAVSLTHPLCSAQAVNGTPTPSVTVTRISDKVTDLILNRMYITSTYQNITASIQKVQKYKTTRRLNNYDIILHKTQICTTPIILKTQCL